MGNNKYLLACGICIIFLCHSCVNIFNPKERNKLVFKNAQEVVIDSICILNDILNKINYPNFTYGVSDSDELYINYPNGSMHRIGLLSDTLLPVNASMNFLNQDDNKRLIGLIIYLNKNYLARCDIEGNQPVYLYRSNIYMADYQEDLDRMIVYVKTEREIDLNRYKILDNYKNLFLLANKDAKVWEGNK